MIKLPLAVHLSLRLPLFIYCNLHANFDNPVKNINYFLQVAAKYRRSLIFQG